jgi:hypothetical protein
VKVQFHACRHFNDAASDINELCERLVNHAWLFVNLLEHKVPMLAFLSENRRAGDLEWRSSQAFAFRIEKFDALPRDHCDVTVFQVIDHVSKRRKSDRV